MRKIILFIFIVLNCFTIVYSTNISSCQTISTSGNYTLTNDIFDHVGTCIDVTANNVQLDCQGYTIDGDDSGTTDDGIRMNRDNFEIRNCQISDFYYGLDLAGADYGVIENVNLTSNNAYGLHYLGNYVNYTNVIIENSSFQGAWSPSNSDFNRFENVIFRNNLGGGIRLVSSADSNTFINVSVIDNTGNGIDIASPNNEFYNLTASGNTGYDLYLSGSSNTIDYINFSDGKYVSSVSQNLLLYNSELSVCGPLSWYGINYTLTNDIVDHVGTCFYNSVANNVQLDCQGYRIDGDDSGTTDDGIRVSRDNFVIRNCQISDFYYGLDLASADYGVIENVNLTSNSAYGTYYLGNYVNYSNVIIENNSLSGAYSPSNSDFNRFENVIFRNNLGDGIFLTTIADSNIFINVSAINNGGDGLDIRSPNNEFYNITAIGNSGNDFFVSGSSNTLVRSFLGSLSVSSSNNLFYGNHFLNSSSISGVSSGIWNTSSPSIGNFYGDSGTCSANETRSYDGYTYYICISPSSFNIGSSGTFDYAPLASSTFVVGNLSSPPSENTSNSTSTSVSSSSVPFGSLTSLIITIGTLSLFFLFN